ncbi:MAG: hypothetical protein AMS24_00865 [Chlamydiae bacterium SM23_39]|nr:MAG: hypothetical protein AMS24_00865 [Chlamydiae bacterium SM23_39]
MIPKRKFREIVFQILFAHHFFKMEEKEYIENMMKMLKASKKNIREAYLYSLNILKKMEEMDEIIKKFSLNYNINRISKVELNILRLGVFEIFFDQDIPNKVAISEAIRLCRKFGTRDSAKFVNAILDNIFKNFKEL